MKNIISRHENPCGVVLVIAAVTIVAAIVSACGKKGPPSPPDSTSRPTPIDLRVHADNDRITLRWRPTHSTMVIAGYNVFRASYPLSGPSCPACHQKFHQIESLASPSDDKANSGEITFSQQVPKGFRYVYKVRPYNRDGEPGADSNAAGVDIP